MNKLLINLVCLILLSFSLIACVRDVATTPLMPPASSGDIRSVKTLLAEGADVNEKNRDGETALMVASEAGQLQVVRELIANGADVNAADMQGHTALIYATRKGYTEIIEKLIANGADLDVKRPQTALELAACKKSDIAEMLIDSGANVNIGNDPPLFESASCGNTRIVNELISAGADVNAIGDGTGHTALMGASEEGHLGVVKLLISSNADVNTKGRNGYTALHIAAIEGHVDVVRELLNHGAEVNTAARNYDIGIGPCSDMPLEASKRLKHTEVTKLLESAGAVEKEPFSQETLNDIAIKDIGYVDQNTSKFIIPLMSSHYDSRVRQIDLVLGETTSHQVKRIFHDDKFYSFGRIPQKEKSKLQGPPGPGIPKQAIDNTVYYMRFSYAEIRDIFIFDENKKLTGASIGLNRLPVYVPCSTCRKIRDIKQTNIKGLMQQYRFSEIDDSYKETLMRSNINPCVVIDAVINTETDRVSRIDYMFVCPT